METLTQVIYHKLAAAPKEYLESKDGRRLIAKAAKLIKAKESREEARYFLNLMVVSRAIF